MNPIFTAFNSALGWLISRSGRAIIGPGCAVRWWGLRALRRGGRLTVGRESIVRCRIDFDSAEGHVFIGNRCYLGASHFVCHTGISLGDDVIMSWGVTVVDHDSHSLAWNERRNDVADWKRGAKDWSFVTVKPVRIGSKAWIGFGASILKGVTIGEGAVIAANAVVTRDVAPWTVVAGNPAKLIRQLDEGQLPP